MAPDKETYLTAKEETGYPLSAFRDDFMKE